MSKEKDFFKRCFNTIAGLEVKNESQAMAKEVVLSEIENLKQENKRLKEKIEEYKNPIKYFKYANKNVTDENKKLNGTIQTYDILLKSNIEENKQLQKRMEYLERSNNRREDIIIEQRQEINNLEDNWDELKEYIKETKLKEFEKSYGKRYGKTFTQAEIIVCNMILDKIQELQGSGSDVKD